MEVESKLGVAATTSATITSIGTYFHMIDELFSIVMGTIAVLSFLYQVYSAQRSYKLKLKHYDLGRREAALNKKEAADKPVILL